MKVLSSASLIVAGFACLGVGVRAQTSTDSDWQALQHAAFDEGANASAFVRAADLYRQYYLENAAGAHVADARCLEGIMLLRAWAAGDNTTAGRRQAIVAQTIHDTSITPELRAELFAYNDSVPVMSRTDLSSSERQQKFNDFAHRLIAEFPQLAIGYESLLGIANDSPDATGATIARELISMPKVPSAVRAQAQSIIDRSALVGKPLASVVAVIGNAPAVFSSATAKPVIIYAWRGQDLGSIRRAVAVVANVPADSVLVGICLDTDLAAARAAAATYKLPGDQQYDPAGDNGNLARALQISHTDCIYGAGRDGIIKSVTLQNDLGMSFAASAH